MITRPLDLASRLRLPPKSFEVLHLFNVALVGLFFALFGSPFVLAPGFSESVPLPTSASAMQGARIITHNIALHRGGVIITTAGQMSLQDLGVWLKSTAANFKQPVLLIQEDRLVTAEELAAVESAALAVGFEIQIAMNPAGTRTAP